MRRVTLPEDLNSWKLIAAVATLTADAEGFWMVTGAASANLPGLDCSVVRFCSMASPSFLYYALLGFQVFLRVAGVLLLVYILTLLEKRVVVLRRFFEPNRSESHKAPRRQDLDQFTYRSPEGKQIP